MFWRSKPRKPALTPEQERKQPVKIPVGTLGPGGQQYAVCPWDSNFVTIITRYLGVDPRDRRTSVYEYTYSHQLDPFMTSHPGGRDLDALKAKLRKRYGKDVFIIDWNDVKLAGWVRAGRPS